MQTGHTHAYQTRFTDYLRNSGCDPLKKGEVTTLQLNLGKQCNQTCTHCHVDAGPHRTEVMSERIIDRLCVLVQSSPSIRVVDLTGGAPELNPGFERLVTTMRSLDREVIDRCNLTVLSEPGMENTAAFLASNRVWVVASLPCYTEDNVDAQRGEGVFEKSIAGLKQLNALGYGQPGSGLVLDLVYNPGGAFLPGPQTTLEADYHAKLGSQFGVAFNNLRTIVNMPINRFETQIEGERETYMGTLVSAFNPATVPGVMCRTQVSVSWEGKLYDCDFNQVLDIPMTLEGDPSPVTVFDIDSFGEADFGPVATATHCFGCTAGAGSSCSGAIAKGG